MPAENLPILTIVWLGPLPKVEDDVLQRDEDVVQQQAGLNAKRDDSSLVDGRED